jgi:hypothetical protein
MTESTKKVVEIVRLVVLILATAFLFHWTGHLQGVREEHARLMQNAVNVGVAKWQVNQENGKSSVVWCAGVFDDKKEKKDESQDRKSDN